MRVLLSYNQPRSNDMHFVNLFAESLQESGVEVAYFTPREVLFGRFDIFSLHWPELLASGSTKTKFAAKVVAIAFLFLRLKIRNLPTVYTMHNIRPHDASTGWLRQKLYAALVNRAVFRVYLNESEENDLEVGAVILHGCFPADRYLGVGRRGGGSGVISFGNVRPYKGLEGLITAAGRMPLRDVQVRIIGSVQSAAYASELVELASKNPNVLLDFRYVEDTELLRQIAESSVAVFPYAQLYNSGAALLALSAGVPVVLPLSPSSASLREELGDAWVTLVSPGADLGDAVLEAIEKSSLVPSGTWPDLSRRQWADIGVLYRSLFNWAALLPRGAGSRTKKGMALRSAVEKDVQFTRHSVLNSSLGIENR